MKTLLLLLCLCLSGCAYGSGSPELGYLIAHQWDDYQVQSQVKQQAMWTNYYQQQQLFQMQNMNNTLRMRPYLGY